MIISSPNPKEGGEDFDNYVAACSPCNGQKASKLLPLDHPVYYLKPSKVIGKIPEKTKPYTLEQGMLVKFTKNLKCHIFSGKILPKVGDEGFISKINKDGIFVKWEGREILAYHHEINPQSEQTSPLSG